MLMSASGKMCICEACHTTEVCTVSWKAVPSYDRRPIAGICPQFSCHCLLQESAAVHSDDGRQQGVQQAAFVQRDKAALAAEVDQGQGSVVCGRFKPAPDGGGMEQNERESPSKMSRQVLGTWLLLIGTQPVSQSTAGVLSKQHGMLCSGVHRCSAKSKFMCSKQAAKGCSSSKANLVG